MALSVKLEPIQSLFDEGTPISKELLKDQVLADFKLRELTGVPDSELTITFNPDDGDDILIHRIDRESALGYSVHASMDEYYDHLSKSLYEPTEEDIQGALNE